MGNILTHGQISGLTDRNHIRPCVRVRLLNKSKPNNHTESRMVNVADRWRERDVWYPGRSAWNALKGVTIVQGNETMLSMQKSAEVIVSRKDEGPNQ